MKKTIIQGNIVYISFFLAVSLHAGLFGGLAAFSSAAKETGRNNGEEKTQKKPIPVALMVIPEIKERGKKPVIKQKEAEKNNILEKEEFGIKKSVKSRAGAAAKKEMLDYKNMVKQKIQAARAYPYEAKWKGLEGSVGLVFTITRAGRVGDVGVLKSSKSEILDTGAVKTVEKAAPFPEPPPGYKGAETKMFVDIVFKLN